MGMNPVYLAGIIRIILLRQMARFHRQLFAPILIVPSMNLLNW